MYPNVSECGGRIEGTSGEISSPGYPSSFAHRHSCTWVITAPQGRAVTITFEDFDLEQPVSWANRSSCQYDWIMVSTQSFLRLFILSQFRFHVVTKILYTQVHTCYVSPCYLSVSL